MEKFTSHLKNTIIIIVGNAILAFGICAFITPRGIIVGGTSGIGLFVKYYTNIPMYITVYTVNIITFIWGYVAMGKKFIAGTLLSTFLFPTFLTLFQYIPGIESITKDMLLSCLYAGLFTGAGIGLVLRVGASTGGVDIPPVIIHQKTGFSVPVMVNGFDAVILLLQFPFSTSEQILYGIVVLLITGLVMDKMMNLGQVKVQITVITPKWEEIKTLIGSDVDRGTTLLNITTGYMMHDSNAVMAVVDKREVKPVLDIVRNVDPTAFVITNDIHSVHGRGFTLPDIDL
jgi:uncharacterized membrane-anchored protein YitT (DUF2179 family)